MPSTVAILRTSTPAQQPEPFGSFCPRWQHCSSGFCPVLGGRHVAGDRVCHFLREATKPGGELRVRGALRAEVAEAVLRHGHRLLSQRTSLGKALRRAARYGSKLDQAQRLNQRPQVDAAAREQRP